MTGAQILHFKALVTAWYHQTRRAIPHGFSPHAPTVGTVFRGMLREYQLAHHLTVTGELDSETQHSLTPVNPRDAKAATTVAYCQWAVTHHGQFTYDEARPIANPPQQNLYGLPRHRDCSAFAEDACYVGFKTSVDGYSFGTGYGNSDSMIAALPHRAIADLRQADLVAFEGPGHVCVVTGPHPTNPAFARWVASNGHQGAPEIVTLQEQIDSHSSYVGLAVD